MGYQFNPLTGNFDLVGGGGGNPFDQDLNKTDSPRFVSVALNNPDGNPDATTTISANGIGNSAGSDSSFSLNGNGIGFQVTDTSTSFTAGQISYTPSGGTQKTYALPPASGTLATTESITFPVTSVNGNTGSVVLDVATFVPPAWINIVNNATDLDVPQITAGYWFLQSGTYGTTTAVYIPNDSSNSHLKVYYSTTDNLWHIVATGGGGDYPEYTTSNSSGYPTNFTITGVSNTDGNTYTRSITFTHGNTVITPTSILSAGTFRYASRLDHTHPVISASDISSGTLNSARLPFSNPASTLTATNIIAPNQTASSGTSILTRDLADARYAVIAKKSSSDSVSSNTTLADVTGLTGFSLEANTTYRFEFTGRMTIAGSCSFQVILSSTAALANPSMSGWSLSTGTRTDNGFGNLSGTNYYFMQKAGSATNNPSSAMYYVVTGSTAPTVKIQFSQQNTSVASGATLLAGAVASFTKLV